LSAAVRKSEIGDEDKQHPDEREPVNIWRVFLPFSIVDAQGDEKENGTAPHSQYQMAESDRGNARKSPPENTEGGGNEYHRAAEYKQRDKKS